MKTIKIIIGIVIVAAIGWFVLKPGNPSVQIAEVVTNETGSVDTGSMVEEENALDELEISKAATYTIAENSVVNWKGEKTGGEHSGIVAISEGSINAIEGKILNGSFTMDMTTIKATDIDDESLDNHLKSEDFFDATNHPTASFEITNITEKEVSGNLTLKGMTKEISFPMAEFTITDDTVSVKAEFAIDRTMWEINGGMPMVSKFIELNIDVTFNKQA